MHSGPWLRRAALPATDFTSASRPPDRLGMIWNIYFGAVALWRVLPRSGVALARRRTACVRKPAEWFVFVFRGSPLFIQFFFGYFLFLSLKQQVPGLGS
jgi:polar amino acid transport system permease protein